MIAHAGGTIYGIRYSNSLDAIENSINNGFKSIELDLNLTKDNQIVFIHNWDIMMKRFFDRKTSEILTFSEFKSGNTLLNIKLLDLKDLIHILDEINDLQIILDIKKNTLEVLNLIREQYGDYMERFVVQIQQLNQYLKVKKMGYNNVMLTLYKIKSSDLEIIKFCKTNDLYGVTMSLKKAQESNLLENISNSGNKVYVHTINDIHLYEELYYRGARGFYTDYLEVNNFPYALD